MPISSLSHLDGDDYFGIVDALADGHRRKEATRRLMKAGTAAVDALIGGLDHDSSEVRVGCCKVLDHFLQEEAIPALRKNLTHARPEVRAWAMHTLACDRCKEGACRPGENETLPIAIESLRHDESAAVRAMAAALVGESVLRSEQAASALEWTAQNDPAPKVRKIAKWFRPGGPRYRKLEQKQSQMH